MRSASIWMLILGIGGFLLPMMGVQFRLLSVFGENQLYMAAGLAVLGAILLIVSLVTDSNKPAS